MKDLVILSAARTAGGSYLGSLSTKTAPELGAAAIAEAVKRAEIEDEKIDELIFGCGWQAGIGPNMARMSLIKAGLTNKIPASTVNMRCGSSLKALSMAAAMIKSEDNDVMIIGGAESTSNIPYLSPDTRTGARMGDVKLIDGLNKDGFFCQLAGMTMSHTADILGKKYNISREEQDQFALESHEKALAAIKAGFFKDEIAPVTVKTRKEEFAFDVDEIPRENISLEKLSRLPSIVGEGGTITAGNSSSLCDGASAMIISSDKFAEKNNKKPIAIIKSYATTALDPLDMGLGPVEATKEALKKAGLKLSDIDLVEANEAFSAQYIAVEKELGFDRKKVNIYGGAIALGHPIGATGTKILTTLIYALRAKKLKYGLATLCINGGHGMSVIVEALP